LQQLTRTRQQLDLVPESQRELYRHMLADIQIQYDELQHELDVLSKALQISE
jgi:hypothetical protein